MKLILISKIRNKKRGWYAELADKHSVYGYGRTPGEAIGNMIEACPDVFNVVIKEGETK